MAKYRSEGGQQHSYEKPRVYIPQLYLEYAGENTTYDKVHGWTDLYIILVEGDKYIQWESVVSGVNIYGYVGDTQTKLNATTTEAGFPVSIDGYEKILIKLGGTSNYNGTHKRGINDIRIW